MLKNTHEVDLSHMTMKQSRQFTNDYEHRDAFVATKDMITFVNTAGCCFGSDEQQQCIVTNDLFICLCIALLCRLQMLHATATAINYAHAFAQALHKLKL